MARSLSNRFVTPKILTVAEHVVRLHHLRELGLVHRDLGGVLQGVARLGHLLEGPLDLVVVGLATDPEALVVVKLLSR